MPGVYVKQGEYLLAVNGRELHASDNMYEFFDGTAGKQTVLRVGPNPDGKDARDVTVVPIPDEDGLRNLDWVESNRRKVDELSGGKVAYVYMPNTGGAGYTNFNRYFYSQLDKQALVLDERWNEGGLHRRLRRRRAQALPAVGGHRARRQADPRSGGRDLRPQGDAHQSELRFGRRRHAVVFPQGRAWASWWARARGAGWWALAAIHRCSTAATSWRRAMPSIGLNGDWEVENRGIPPDVEVELLPKDVAEGHDRQLEKACRWCWKS